MPRKLTRFTVAPDGTIVYAATGKSAPSDYYLVRDARGRPAGVYRVADNSVRRVRVGSFREEKNLLKKQKEKIRKQQQKRGWGIMEGGFIGPRGPTLPPAPPKPGHPTQGMKDAAASGLLSIRDRGHVNFTRRIEALYLEGKISREEADGLLAKYAEAGDTKAGDAERTKMWDDINEKYAGGADQRYGSP